MDRLQMRAVAREVARASRVGFSALDSAMDPRGRTSRETSVPEIALDCDRARSACAAMGTLESIVVSRTARNQTRTHYVIVPDPALAAEYARLGLALTPGCRILVDAAALRPLAVLTMTEVAPRPVVAQETSPSGFNPYFDVPAA